MNDEIILITWGGLGDLLMCTPAIAALKASDPKRRVVAVVRSQEHADILRNNPNIDLIKRRSPNRRWFKARLYLERKMGKRHFELQFQRIPLNWLYTKNVMHVVAEMLGVSIGVAKAQVFFTPDEESRARDMLRPYTNPVLMHVNSTASRNHLWQMEKWETLIKELPGCTFIQMGEKTDPEVKGAVDFRGRTTVREAICLLKFAASFVGVDSVMAHATTVFDLPGVVLHGDGDPVCWGHPNNINIYKNLDCSPCYYMLWGMKCPYGNECMESITVAEVKEALGRQLQARVH